MCHCYWDLIDSKYDTLCNIPCWLQLWVGCCLKEGVVKLYLVSHWAPWVSEDPWNICLDVLINTWMVPESSRKFICHILKASVFLISRWAWRLCTQDLKPCAYCCMVNVLADVIHLYITVIPNNSNSLILFNWNPEPTQTQECQ